jgi:hypothetical protein
MNPPPPSRTPRSIGAPSAQATSRSQKKQAIELDGTVVDALPNTQFKVRLDNGHEVLAYMSLASCAGSAFVCCWETVFGSS